MSIYAPNKLWFSRRNSTLTVPLSVSQPFGVAEERMLYGGWLRQQSRNGNRSNFGNWPGHRFSSWAKSRARGGVGPQFPGTAASRERNQRSRWPDADNFG